MDVISTLIFLQKSNKRSGFIALKAFKNLMFSTHAHGWFRCDAMERTQAPIVASPLLKRQPLLDHINNIFFEFAFFILIITYHFSLQPIRFLNFLFYKYHRILKFVKLVYDF